MKLEDLQIILSVGNIQEKHDAFRNIESQLINEEIFQSLCLLLNDKDSKVRFFSIYYLIDKFSSFLSKADQKLTDKIYKLIFDENGPVADRAVWAIGITGDIGLNKLMNEYRITSGLVKSRIVMALGRSDFSYRLEDRITVLLDATKSTNEDIRFIAMCEIMSNAPVGSWKRNYDSKVDFEKIYSTLLPVAMEFSKSDSIMHREFAQRYIDQIHR